MVYRYTGAHPHLATMVAYDADEMDTYIAEFEAKVARLAADRESKAEDDDKMWDVIINEIDPLGQG